MFERAEKIRVGIVGLGFMGKTHLNAYAKAGADIVALADARIDDIVAGKTSGGNLATGGDAFPLTAGSFRKYTSPGQVFADQSVEAVSICTPTDTHVELACQALAAGKHVLLEKPVAISSDAVVHLLAKAKLHRMIMPAMCMRFWPGWTWLRDSVPSAGDMGKLRGITFQRLASPPGWNAEFYKNSAKTGGALFDLHIHDADFVYWLLGMPKSVLSVGDENHVTTTYQFESGVRITAEGGWDHAPGFPFRMRYTAVFEHAAADFDISRDPALQVTLDGQFAPFDLPSANGYEREIAHFLSLVEAKRPEHNGGKNVQAIATLEDALAVTRLLEAERESLKQGTPITI